jgi:hypothetical protein
MVVVVAPVGCGLVVLVPPLAAVVAVAEFLGDEHPPSTAAQIRAADSRTHRPDAPERASLKS